MIHYIVSTSGSFHGALRDPGMRHYTNPAILNEDVKDGEHVYTIDALSKEIASVKRTVSFTKV